MPHGVQELVCFATTTEVIVVGGKKVLNHLYLFVQGAGATNFTETHVK